MSLSRKNIFGNIPAELPDELFEEIMAGNNFKVERIVSRGHHSPEGFWYDQDENEWVILLAGRAVLLFEGRDETVELHPGNYILISRHLRHRVEWTDPDQDTIWLALFYK